jgi:uncharacterized protein YheU (UPF0270 family)
MMLIPYRDLPTETLDNVIKDWLSRQSQDSMPLDLSESERVSQVRQMLANQTFLVSWDDESQTINLVAADSLPPTERES